MDGTFCILILTLILWIPSVSASVCDEQIQAAVDLSAREMKIAAHNTRQKLAMALQSPNTRLLFTSLRVPSGKAHDLTLSAEVMERSRDHLRKDNLLAMMTPAQMITMMDMSGCHHTDTDAVCMTSGFHQRYRSLDGRCNNIDYPKWGSSMTPMPRMLPARYEDDYSEPFGWNEGFLHKGFEIPMARKVTNELMSAGSITNDNLYTDFLTQWGQFIDHDIDLTPLAPIMMSEGISCDVTCDNIKPCFPIKFPDNDPRNISATCMPFTRSAGYCNSDMRNQVNSITAFIDASMVYGSSDDEAQLLREFYPNTGKLRTGERSPYNKHYMPFKDGSTDCLQNPLGNSEVPCFLAGDTRANEQIGLATLHTIWMREHNRIAAELEALNPGLDGDSIFYETRSIVGAMIQAITYDQYLPKILGPSGMADIGGYSGYKSDIDASVFNEFSTAAFRFGHGNVHTHVFRFDEMLNPTAYGHVPLPRAFFSSYLIIDEGGIDPILRGMFGFPAKQVLPDEVMTSELTEQLFALANMVASDLSSLNIQRGRDNGLQSYNAYREACGLTRAATFDDLAEDIPDQATRDTLQALYGHPDNMDLFVGGMIEEQVSGARVGPVFSCILAKQFINLRDGDKFWYGNSAVFTPEKQAEIHKASLSRVICDNAENIQELPNDVFVNTALGDFVSCDNISSMDLSYWTDIQPVLCECSNCSGDNGNVGFGPHFNCHFYYRCDKTSGGYDRKHEMCCPDGLYWNQDDLTCKRYNPGTAPVCPDNYQCDTQSTYIDGECTLSPAPEPNKYTHMLGNIPMIRECGAGTIFKQDQCGCGFPETDEERQYTESCSSDPLLRFRFNKDYSDSQCIKATGNSYGQTTLTPYDQADNQAENQADNNCDGSSNCAVCFDGDGDFVKFEFLNNWFSWKKQKQFCVTMWFKQTQEGYSKPKEGLFQNGNCEEVASIWLAMAEGTTVGGYNSDLFGYTTDEAKDARGYQPNVWNHIGMCLDNELRQFYLNGNLVDSEESEFSYVKNTQVGVTIGMVDIDCISHYFTGCIDDLCVYDRTVDGAEMQTIYNNGPQ